MFDVIKLPVAAAAGAALAGVAVFIWAEVFALPDAREEGRAAAISQARQSIFVQLKQRNVTNEAIGKMSDGERCRLVGGVLTNGECT
ncbi:Hypothetical protein NGAL_HAMBI2605_59040 [Neorhizobium galegae bv. orientalis]|nr:Hypothetical protein NGAL_HAMBI2605_59040 [Neorhizobium galegae bv. orientalis]